MAGPPHDHPSRRRLLSLAALLFTFSILIWTTGGFATSVAGIRVSARTPAASALAGAVAVAMWLAAAWRVRAVRADLVAAAKYVDRRALRLIALVAAAVGAVATRHHTFSATGADASGYLSEAAMLASGALSYVEPLTSVANWTDAPRTLAPLGWQATVAGTQVPTYAAGLPLLMVIPHMAGGPVAASLVVGASAAVAVWWAGRLAMAVAGGAAGVLASIALASVPVMLFFSMQPMSDVPVTAAWLGAWWWVDRAAKGDDGRSFRYAMAGGIAAATAVLVRPNLAPLAAVPALYLWSRRGPSGARHMLAFAVPVALAGGLVAFFQWHWFGSPLRSGYGTAAEIYSTGNIGTNVGLYSRWLLDTSGGWLLLGASAVLLRARPVIHWLLAFAGLVVFAYLIYGPFEAWPYLRFLLPALAVLCIATAAVLTSVVRRLPAALQFPILFVLMLAIGALQVTRARELGVFTVAANHARAVLAGRYVDSAAPADAVLLTGEQSGSMRYYTRRPIVRWDFLAPQTLPLVLQRLQEGGHELWIVLDDWEVASFRDRFRSVPGGALDWPPSADAGSIGRTQVWRLRDRAPFMTGSRVTTDRLR